MSACDEIRVSLFQLKWKILKMLLKIPVHDMHIVCFRQSIVYFWYIF